MENQEIQEIKVTGIKLNRKRPIGYRGFTDLEKMTDEQKKELLEKIKGGLKKYFMAKDEVENENEMLISRRCVLLLELCYDRGREDK